jgi:adenylate cyclase
MTDPPTQQRLLAAIMFTDMVGFSAVSQKNEALALELLEEQRRIVRSALAAHRGREVKTGGDGFMITFASALEAVNCAIAIQAAIAALNETQAPDHRFQLRIGVHVGDVLVQGEDLIGDGVNVAARIEPLAEPGGICVTGPVVDQVWNKLPVQMVSMGQPSLKNITTPLEVFRIVMPGEAVSSRSIYQPRRKQGKPIAVIGVGAIILLAVAALLLRGTKGKESGKATAGPVDPKSIRSLAVLPLRNMTNDPKQNDFIAGLTDSLTTDISHIGSIRVVSYQSARQCYGSGNRSMPEMAQTLNVDAIVEGSVQKLGDHFVINAQLIHGPTDQHIWAEKFEKDARNLLQAQNEIVLAVADAIKLRLTGEEKSRFAARRALDPEALSHYYQGKAEFGKGEAGFHRAIKEYDQALSIDSKFALAWAGEADAYASLSSLSMRPREAMPKAERAAQKALELDPNLAEAHAALGYLLAFYHWDRAAGKKEMEEAIRLNPNYPTAYMNYGIILLSEGRAKDALVQLRKAQELEPTSANTSFQMEWAFFLDRKYDETIAQSQHTLKLEPNSPVSHSQMGLAYLYKGDTARAVSELKFAMDKFPNSATVTFYAFGLAKAGRTAEASRVMDKFIGGLGNSYVCAYEVACAYEGMGDRARALQWMRRGYEEKCDCLVWSGTEPWMGQILKDPSFKAILAKAGLEQAAH